jgi:nucleoside-triphosphatase THEP1
MSGFNKGIYIDLMKSIWGSFLASSKKHLFITGSKASGKSTFLKFILGHDIDYSGIITRAIRTCRNVPEYILLEDIRNPSVNAIIGVKNQQGNGVLPELKGFEDTGVKILRQCLENKSDWVVIDEIGFLESNAPVYQEALRACLESKRVIAVLRKDSRPFLDELKSRQDVFLIDLDSF